MSASAGPSLQGIGRGGDSNLVLEMDAHDAKSYPGEPTTNVINTLMTGWTNDNGCTVTATGETFQGMPVYRVLFPDGSLPRTHTNFTYTSGSDFTMHVWYRYVSGETGTYLPQPYITAADWSATFATGTFPVTKEWTRMTPLTGTSGGTVTAMFNLYRSNSGSATDVTMEFALPQMEEKSYATPFVREGKGGTGTYNARPASVNLMIHGDVGTGQTFSDSSPSKHTITTSGNTTHSSAQSKFSGGSISFDGTGDYLTAASSSDFNLLEQDFTIDMWINFGVIENMDICDIKGYADGLSFRLKEPGGAGKIGCYLENNNHTWTWTPSTDTWYHLALVRHGATLKCYVDGTALTATAGGDPSGQSIAQGAFQIGQWLTGAGAQDFEGYIDELRFTKATALWTSAFTPPTRRNLSAPVVDRSGNDNGGNFATTATTDVTNYRVGEVIRPIGSAVWDFDGTDDEINMGHAGGAFIKDGVDRTIAQWVVSPTATATYMSSLGYRKSADETGGWMIYWRQGYIRIWNAGGSHSPEVAGNTFAANTIYHVVATWPSGSGNTVKLYINGEYISAADGITGISADSTSNELSIGRYGANSGFHYTGKVYNTQIYDTVLTAQQVKENFNQQRSRFKV